MAQVKESRDAMQRYLDQITKDLMDEGGVPEPAPVQPGGEFEVLVEGPGHFDDQRYDEQDRLALKYEKQIIGAIQKMVKDIKAELKGDKKWKWTGDEIDMIVTQSFTEAIDNASPGL